MLQDSESPRQPIVSQSERSSPISRGSISSIAVDSPLFNSELYQDNWSLNDVNQYSPLDTSEIHSDVEVLRSNIHTDSPIHPLVDPIEAIGKTVEATCGGNRSLTSLSVDDSQVTPDMDTAPTNKSDEPSARDGEVGEMLRRQTELTDLLHSLNTELTTLLHEEWTLTGKAPEEFKDISSRPIKDTSFPIPKQLHRTMTMSNRNRANQPTMSLAQRKNVISLEGMEKVKIDSLTEQAASEDNNSMHRLMTSTITASNTPYDRPGYYRPTSNYRGGVVDKASDNGKPVGDVSSIGHTYRECSPTPSDNPQQLIHSKTIEGGLTSAKSDPRNIGHTEGNVGKTNDQQDSKWLQFTSYELQLRRLEVDWDVINELHAVHKKRAEETKLESYRLAYRSNARKLQDIRIQMTTLQEKMDEIKSVKSEYGDIMPSTFKSPSQKGSVSAKTRRSRKTRSSTVSVKHDPYDTEYLFKPDAPSGPPTQVVQSELGPSAWQCTPAPSGTVGSRGQTVVGGTISNRRVRRPSVIPFANMIKTITGRNKSPSRGSIPSVLSAMTVEADHELKVEQCAEPSTPRNSKRASDCSDWIEADIEPQSNSTYRSTGCATDCRYVSRCTSLPSRLQMLACAPIEGTALMEHQHNSRSHNLLIANRDYPEFLVHQINRQRSFNYGYNVSSRVQRLTSYPLVSRYNHGHQFDKQIPSVATTSVTASITKNGIKANHTDDHYRMAGPSIYSQYSSTSSYCSTSGCSCLSSPNSTLSASSKPVASQPDQTVTNSVARNATCDGAHQRHFDCCPEHGSKHCAIPLCHMEEFEDSASLDVKCICRCTSQVSDKDGDATSTSSWASIKSGDKKLIGHYPYMSCRPHSRLSATVESDSAVDQLLSTPETVISSQKNRPEPLTRDSKDVAIIDRNSVNPPTPSQKINPSNPYFTLPSIPSISQSNLQSKHSTLQLDTSTTHLQNHEKLATTPVPHKKAFRSMRRSISRIIWSTQKVRPPRGSIAETDFEQNV